MRGVYVYGINTYKNARINRESKYDDTVTMLISEIFVGLFYKFAIIEVKTTLLKGLKTTNFCLRSWTSMFLNEFNKQLFLNMY